MGGIIAWACLFGAIGFAFWIADDIREALNDPCDDRPEGDCPAVPPAFHAQPDSQKGAQQNVSR